MVAKKKNKTENKTDVMNSARDAVENLKNLKKISMPIEESGGTGDSSVRKPRLENDSQIELTKETSLQRIPDSENETGVNQSDYVITKAENIILHKVAECESKCKSFTWKLLGGIVAMLVVLVGGYLLYINFRLDKVDKEITEIKEKAVFRKDMQSKYLK